MSRVRIEEHAVIQIEDIYLYTSKHWGEDQVDAYLRGLTAAFEDLAARRIVPRRISAAFGVDGYVHRYRHHFIYWKQLSPDTIGVFAVLHERQHQVGRLLGDAG